jgi:hypothetical protein
VHLAAGRLHRDCAIHALLPSRPGPAAWPRHHATACPLLWTTVAGGFPPTITNRGPPAVRAYCLRPYYILN